MSSLRVIDVDTGEIKTEGYSIRNDAQDEAARKHYEKERYIEGTKDRHWVAGYHDPIRNLLYDLTLTEAGAIIKLLPYLRFKSEGRLIMNGKPLTQAQIQRVFKRGKTATKAILDKLTETGVITVMKEGRSNVFYISAEFHSMGIVKEGERFTKLYQVKTREITDGLDLHETGLLYKILPFFHYAEYYLCANPNEDNPATIRHMDRESLAQAIGHEPETVSRCVALLQRKGALLSTRSGKSVRYLIHPDVMFRQSTETDWTQAVRKMFDQHRK